MRVRGILVVRRVHLCGPISGFPPPLGPGPTRVGFLGGGGGALQRGGARTLLLLWRVEIVPGPGAKGRGRRMLVLRAWRQRLVRTLSHHVCDALAVVAFLWLGGQAALLGVVIQTSTVITAAAAERENTHAHVMRSNHDRATAPATPEGPEALKLWPLERFAFWGPELFILFL